MSFLAKLRDRMSGRTLVCAVRFDTEGFAIEAYEKQPVFIRWTEVKEVCGFKRDLFSVDEIRLGFRYGVEDSFTSVGEDDISFKDFRSEVERRFGLDEAWFARIAQPPFAENRTTLWQRA
jgi:hypothetical protein